MHRDRYEGIAVECADHPVIGQVLLITPQDAACLFDQPRAVFWRGGPHLVQLVRQAVIELVEHAVKAGLHPALDIGQCAVVLVRGAHRRHEFAKLAIDLAAGGQPNLARLDQGGQLDGHLASGSTGASGTGRSGHRLHPELREKHTLGIA